ncbi:MAG: hypothetical protein WBG65_05055 [Sulfurimonadaceae bacterium]
MFNYILYNRNCQAKIQDTTELLKYRDSDNDVLRSTIKSELNRTDINSIIIANFKRAQESSRVLKSYINFIVLSIVKTLNT